MGNGAPVHTEAPCVECIVPILSVINLEASIRFYVDALGFRVDWRDDNMASVSRDGKAIMLCARGQGQPGTWIWIGVNDIQPLFEQFRSNGVKFVEQPTNYPWAHEMKIEDPDGHVLRFGSDPKIPEQA